MSLRAQQQTAETDLNQPKTKVSGTSRTEITEICIHQEGRCLNIPVLGRVGGSEISKSHRVPIRLTEAGKDLTLKLRKAKA